VNLKEWNEDETEDKTSPPFGTKSTGYTSWTQTSGYFDGDGSAHVRLDSPVVLRFTLVWVDNSRDQLSQLRRFLLSVGIKVGGILNHGSGASGLQIASPKAVLAAATRMSPYCFKKYEELRIVIDYYENRITGTEAILRLNELVRQGIRLGKIRTPPRLPKYNVGKYMVARARGLKGAQVTNAKRANLRNMLSM